MYSFHYSRGQEMDKGANNGGSAEEAAAKRPKREKKTAKEMKERAKALRASGILPAKKKQEPKTAGQNSGAEGKPKKDTEKKKKEKKRKSGGDGDGGGGGGGGGGQLPPAKKAKISDDKNLAFPVLVRGLGEVSVADLKDVFSECGEVICTDSVCTVCLSLCHHRFVHRSIIVQQLMPFLFVFALHNQLLPHALTIALPQ